MTTSPALARPPLPETIPPGADPVSWGRGCTAHRNHSPQPRYLELHHVVPRAWQAAWQPPGVSSPVVWAPHTVPLCRTGHGNVHYWIERMMTFYKGSIDEARLDALRGQHGASRNEVAIAVEALTGFQAAGGDLADLAARGILGGLYGGNTE